MAARFGSMLLLKINCKYGKRDSPPDYNEYSSYKTQHTPSDIEIRIPLIEDPLNVTKRESTSDAAIKNQPLTP